MAILIKCAKCKTRLNTDAEPCRACGDAGRLYFVDYYPKGRYGPRVRQELPPAIASENEARQIAALIKSGRRKTKQKALALPNLTVRKLFGLYLDHCDLHLAKSTVVDMRSVDGAHFDAHLGDKIYTELSNEDLEYYQKMRKAEKASNRTINKEMDYFSGFRKWCRQKHKLEAPADRVDKLPTKRPKPMILSLEEAMKIIDAAEPFYKAFFIALFSAGLRMDEARQLKVRDIDFKNRILRVVQKGGSYKVLPASDWLLSAIEEILPATADPDHFIFLNEKTGKPIGQVRKALARACKKAEVDRHVYPHLFRHSVATFLMGKNVNLRVIQGYLGHSKVGTTEFYTHLAVDNLREAEKTIMKEYRRVRSAKGKGK